MGERTFCCRVCQRRFVRRKFSHAGQHQCVCLQVQHMLADKRDRTERLDVVHRMLHQPHISAKNVERLAELSRHPNSEVASLSALVLDIARGSDPPRAMQQRGDRAHTQF